MLSDSDVERALVVTAHPDDVDFGSAGTIASWTHGGTSVSYCIVTDGDAGGFDRSVPRSEIPRIRQAEQRAAAAVVGVSDVRFLGYPDGRVEASYRLRRDIAREIRRARPQRMIIQSPERNLARIAAGHPDHRAVGEATLNAIYPDARNPFAHPELLQEEGLESWSVPEVWISGGPRLNHYVDITDTFEQKVTALRAHASQTGHMTDLEDLLRNWLTPNAKAAGLPAGRLAEAYQVVEIPT
jgi:LmbE family N-acetylglucosaminyl deacetylase